MLEVGKEYLNGYGVFVVIVKELKPLGIMQTIRVFEGNDGRSYFESGRTLMDKFNEPAGMADLILTKPKITLEL